MKFVIQQQISVSIRQPLVIFCQINCHLLYLGYSHYFFYCFCYPKYCLSLRESCPTIFQRMPMSIICLKPSTLLLAQRHLCLIISLSFIQFFGLKHVQFFQLKVNLVDLQMPVVSHYSKSQFPTKLPFELPIAAD